MKRIEIIVTGCVVHQAFIFADKLIAEDSHVYTDETSKKKYIRHSYFSSLHLTAE